MAEVDLTVEKSLQEANEEISVQEATEEKSRENSKKRNSLRRFLSLKKTSSKDDIPSDPHSAISLETADHKRDSLGKGLSARMSSYFGKSKNEPESQDAGEGHKKRLANVFPRLFNIFLNKSKMDKSDSSMEGACCDNAITDPDDLTLDETIENCNETSLVKN